MTRWVKSNGMMHWKGKVLFIGEAFGRQQVALRERAKAIWEVRYCRLLIGELWERDQGAMRPAHYHRGR